MECWSWLRLLVLTGCCLQTGLGHNYIMVSFLGKSPTAALFEIGCELAKRGHGASLVLSRQFQPFTDEEADQCGVELIHIPKTFDFKPPGTSTPVWQMARLLNKFAWQFAAATEELISSDERMDELRKRKFDYGLIVGFLPCISTALIPIKLGIPYTAYSSLYNPEQMGVPGLPSFVPHILGGWSDRMTFFERLGSVLSAFGQQQMFLMGADDQMVRRHAPLIGSTFGLSLKADFWLVGEDPVIDYPKPSMPHIAFVGGLSSKPAGELTGRLAEVMSAVEESNKHVVYVSFGSVVEAEEVINNKLMEVFRRLPEIEFVWKYSPAKIDNSDKAKSDKEDEQKGTVPRPEVSDNVHVFSWLPQNDLLGHPRCHLFVTHGGSNSQYEGLYHGVTMLSLPFGGDQGMNSYRLADKGLGLMLNPATSSADSIAEAIAELLTNTSYRERMIHASNLFRAQPHPVHRAADHLEFAATYGTTHLRSASIQMPWYQYYMVDVMVFVAFCLHVLAYLLYKCCRRVCALCGRRAPVKHEKTQ